MPASDRSPERRESRPAAGLALATLLAVVLLLALLRTVHIEADTPRSQWYGSVAIFVDEGYKTLSPRNLLLFGESHWNPADGYPGWTAKSPLTQWPYYVAFRLLGADVESARLVTVAYFALLLVGFAALLRSRYPPGLLLLGLLLLGVLETLFFFSRVALFEIPIATFVYLLLFLLASRRVPRPGSALALVAAFAVVVTLGVKSSGLLCFVPIAAGVMLSSRLRDDGRLRLGRFELLAGALLLVLLALTWNEWGYRFGISPSVPRSVLLNPLTVSSGLLIAAALLCVSHGLLVQGRRYLADPYRASLVGLATLGPFLLALFPRNPLRYYVPFLPAYVLLVVEWLHLGLWRRPLRQAPSAARTATSFALLVWAIFSLGQVIDQRLLVRLVSDRAIPWIQGSGTGVWNSPRFLAAVLLGLVLGLVIWKWRRRALVGRPILAMVTVLVALEGAQSVVTLGRFFASPSRETREISGLLQQRLPEGASIAGDWAPRFALGTDLKALYMTTDFNHPRRILKIRPDYFVFCDDPDGDGRRVRQLLRETAGVSLGEPRVEATYLGFEVVVYPLQYAPEPPAAGAPADAVREAPSRPRARRTGPRRAPAGGVTPAAAA